MGRFRTISCHLHLLLQPLLILIIATCLTGITGCERFSPSSQRLEKRYSSLSIFQDNDKSGKKELTEWQLQLRLMAFADRSLAELSDASDQLKLVAQTPEQRIAAHKVKLLPATSAVINAADPNPDMALLNMYVTIVLERTAWRESWGEERFPGQCDVLYEKHDSLELEITDILLEVLPQERVDELNSYIHQWWTEHPNTSYIAFVRFDEFATEFRKKHRLIALNMLTISNNIDKATAAVNRAMYLGERTLYISERLPTLIRWQTEMAGLNMASSPELNTAINSLDKISKSTEQFQQTIQSLPNQISEERQTALLQLQQLIQNERNSLITEFDKRTETIQKVLSEGTAVAQSTEAAAIELKSSITTLNEVVNSTNELLTHFDTTLASVDQLATKLKLDEERSTEDNNIEIYAKMAEDISNASSDLKELSETMNKLLDSPKWKDRLHDFNTATKTRMDTFYYRIIYLIIFFWVGGIIPIFAYFFYRDYQRAKRRRASQSRDT